AGTTRRVVTCSPASPSSSDVLTVLLHEKRRASARRFSSSCQVHADGPHDCASDRLPACATTALADDPHHKVQRVQQIEQGYAFLRDGHVPSAAAPARQLVERHPDHAGVLVLAAETSLAHNDPDTALGYIDRAIAVSDGHAALMLKKASLLAHLRRRDEAVTTARGAAARY